MREIKFRAWDKVRTEFLSAGQVFISVEARRRPDDAIIYLDILKYPNTFKDRFILMQYTGLRDIHNKEIYEGDIFKAPHDFGPGGFSERIASVAFDPENGYQWNYWDLSKIEVIGNIHETPELLK